MHEEIVSSEVGRDLRKDDFVGRVDDALKALEKCLDTSFEYSKSFLEFRRYTLLNSFLT